MKEQIKNIGRTAIYRINELKFRVEIIDVKNSFGNLRYKIQPKNGEGEVWVNVSSINIIE